MVGGCLVDSRMFSSIPGVYPLDASSMPPFPVPPVVTTEVSPDIAK